MPKKIFSKITIHGEVCYRSEQVVSERLVDDDFILKLISALDMDIPVKKINDLKWIQNEILGRIIEHHEDSIKLSWIDSPEGMGR